MRKVWVRAGWGLMVLLAGVGAHGQGAEHHTGKAGQWQITTTMTWKRAPLAQGRPGGAPAAGTHTNSVCLTQAMVDAGALLPHSQGQCRIANKMVKPGSLTADYVCIGKLKGKGLLETSFPDLEHSNGSLHFEGTLEVGTLVEPVEWTTTSTAVLKSAQCEQPKAAVDASQATQVLKR